MIFTASNSASVARFQKRRELMSKHKSAEDKLHVGKEVRQKLPAGRANEPATNAAPQVPDKGTNANNQYR